MELIGGTAQHYNRLKKYVWDSHLAHLLLWPNNIQSAFKQGTHPYSWMVKVSDVYRRDFLLRNALSLSCVGLINLSVYLADVW